MERSLDHITNLIYQYGFWAIIFGVLLEGDLTLVVAGMLAHERLGNFGLLPAFAFAMTGALAGDLLAFFAGRRLRNTMSRTRFYRKFHPRMEWLDMRYGAGSIIVVKYIYGLRFASSVFWGMSRMNVFRFLGLTLLSCTVWVGMLTGVGFLCGSAIGQFFEHHRHAGVVFSLGVAAVIGLLLYIAHHWWLSPTLQHEAERAGLIEETYTAETIVMPEKPDGERRDEGAAGEAQHRREPLIRVD